MVFKVEVSNRSNQSRDMSDMLPVHMDLSNLNTRLRQPFFIADTNESKIEVASLLNV